MDFTDIKKPNILHHPGHAENLILIFKHRYWVQVAIFEEEHTLLRIKLLLNMYKCNIIFWRDGTNVLVWVSDENFGIIVILAFRIFMSHKKLGTG